MPDPQVGADDILVRIRAASINPLDLKLRDGAFKAILPYRLPLILGNDLAEVVVQVVGLHPARWSSPAHGTAQRPPI